MIEKTVKMIASFVLICATVMANGVANAKDIHTIVVAGGCFWCVEKDFDQVDGILKTISGYTGGTVDNPTYKAVSSQTTGHYEAVELTYDADRLPLEDLLHIFWRTIDPTDAGGQFCDRGSSYRTAVFVADAEEAAIAEASREEAQAALGKKIVTPILEAARFWPAEEYHQNYHDHNPLRYAFYRKRCGRNARVTALWGDAAGGGTY